MVDGIEGPRRYQLLKELEELYREFVSVEDNEFIEAFGKVWDKKLGRVIVLLDELALLDEEADP